MKKKILLGLAITLTALLFVAFTMSDPGLVEVPRWVR